MLTGDKIETAKCIAISAGFKSVSQSIVEIRNKTDSVELKDCLIKFSETSQNSLLLIDGETLEMMIKYHEKLFFALAQEAPAVVCCRCAPKQKA
jgi:phospholipid-translocating ATPase